MAFLNYHSQKSFFMACLIFAIQVILCIVVVNDNVANYEEAREQKDPFVIVIDFCTTVFIIVFCFGQYSSARTFCNATQGAVGRSMVDDGDLVIQITPTRSKFRPWLCLQMNAIMNQHFLMLAPFFNFYFILLSNNAMDALLNGFSLLFIFELDDYIQPLFDGVDIEDQLAINAHDFISKHQSVFQLLFVQVVIDYPAVE